VYIRFSDLFPNDPSDNTTAIDNESVLGASSSSFISFDHHHQQRGRYRHINDGDDVDVGSNDEEIGHQERDRSSSSSFASRRQVNSDTEGAQFVNSSFVENSADLGGALFVSRSCACVFVRVCSVHRLSIGTDGTTRLLGLGSMTMTTAEQSSKGGGGWGMLFSPVCQFSNNTASSFGGAIYIDSPFADAQLAPISVCTHSPSTLSLSLTHSHSL